MIHFPIRIVLVEDNPADVALIKRQIKKVVESPIIKTVDEFKDFKLSVYNFNPDIIVSDYRLKGFNGSDVKQFLDNLLNNIPLVFITGTTEDDEIAANSILSKASAYVLKKNMGVLHEKLLPYLEKIATAKRKFPIEESTESNFVNIERLIADMKKEIEANTPWYNGLKKLADKLKSMVKK